MKHSTHKVRGLLLAVFMLISVTALGLSNYGRSTNREAVGDFCETCEARCYRSAENIPDYNACVVLCNYAGCSIPLILARSSK